MNGFALKKFCEQHGYKKTIKLFEEGIKNKKIDPYKLHLKELAEAFLGRDYLTSSAKLKAYALNKTHLLEATEAVDASAFGDITGQLLVTIVKEKYESADFVTDKFYRVLPNPGGNLKSHRIPYLSDVDSYPKLLSQAEPYPFSKFQESWVDLPAPEKWGHICTVTMEMIYSDLTGQAQDSAGSIGRALGYNRELRRLRVLLGTVQPYSWNGNSLNTYVSTAGTGSYANKLLNTTILNYEHINSMEQLFWNMADPITGRLINVKPTQMLVMPEKRYTVKRILNGTEVRQGNTASSTSTDMQTVSANPLEWDYEVVTSAIARNILLNEASLSSSVVKERVYFGDFKRALFYREVYPLKVEQAPAMNPFEFQQDIVIAVKASEFGVACVYDPRFIGLCTSEGS